MRISDWSSDLCSSDLPPILRAQFARKGDFDLAGKLGVLALLGCLDAVPQARAIKQGAFAGGGGILRQARPDSRREILLVAAFYGRARKATAQFYPAMATHFAGVWPNAPILNDAERTQKYPCRLKKRNSGG